MNAAGILGCGLLYVTKPGQEENQNQTQAPGLCPITSDVKIINVYFCEIKFLFSGVRRKTVVFSFEIHPKPINLFYVSLFKSIAFLCDVYYITQWATDIVMHHVHLHYKQQTEYLCHRCYHVTWPWARLGQRKGC